MHKRNIWQMRNNVRAFTTGKNGNKETFTIHKVNKRFLKIVLPCVQTNQPSQVSSLEANR